MKCKDCKVEMQHRTGVNGEFYACTSCRWTISDAKIQQIINRSFTGNTASNDDQPEIDMSCPLCCDGTQTRERKALSTDGDLVAGQIARVCNNRLPGARGCPFVQTLPENAFEWTLSVSGLAAQRTIGNAIPDAVALLNKYAAKYHTPTVEQETLAMAHAVPGFDDKQARDINAPDGQENTAEQTRRIDYFMDRTGKFGVFGNLPYDKNDREPGLKRTGRENPDPENR